MPPNDQNHALKTADLAAGTCRLAYAEGQQIAVFNVDGKFYATQAECTHRGGPLCEGDLAGEIITCPWHGSQFNVRTGEVISDPATEPLKTYTVTERDGELIVDL